MLIRSQWWRIVPAVAWMAIIFLLSSQQQAPDTPLISDQIAAVVAHLVLYGVLAILIAFAATANGRPLTAGTALSAIALAVLYGMTDEVHQSFVPGRDASPFDIIVDLVGATLGVGVWWMVSRRIGSLA